MGVAYKFAQAFTSRPLWEDLDLVALGTIADSVALNGENRIIVREGLKRLSRSPRLGIQALMDISGIDNQKLPQQEDLGNEAAESHDNDGCTNAVLHSTEPSLTG